MKYLLSNLRCLLVVLGSVCCLGNQAAFAQNVVRGTEPGWPGNTAYYAPQNVYQISPGGVVPGQAQYAPQVQASYYAPAAATRMAYAVPAAGSYQVTYAGANQPGTATTAYYGGFSPPVQRVAYYAPQQVYYRPVAVAPVQYYRPVVAYQPGVVVPGAAVATVPQTCGYASCQTSSCGSSCGSSCSSSCWSPWRPFAWLWRGSSCGSNTCCKPACAPQGCGAAAVPYYTPNPTIPTVIAPGAGAPLSPFGRNTIVTPGTVPSPPTRTPGGIITTEPANTTPRLGPGTVIPNPGTAPFTPGSTAPFTPGSTAPYSPAPFTPAPSIPGGPVPGAYRPTFSDTYSQPPATSGDAPVMLQPPPALSPPTSSSTFNPSGFRSTSDRTNLQLQAPSTITEPGLPSAPGLNTPPSSVQPLRDPHGEERNRNRAPQLLTPGSDRTAKADQRWAVVPAVWPVKANEVQPVAQSQPQAQPAMIPVAPQSQLDDGGWKSAR